MEELFVKEEDRVEMDYPTMERVFYRVNEKSLPHVRGYIVFASESFCKEYNETSRTYVTSSNNKAYQSGMAGYSIYASCLDGTDQCLRLDGYMRGDNALKIEKCYMLRSECERIIKETGDVI